MKYFTSGFLIACMLFVCLSCGQNEATTAKIQDKQETPKEKKGTKKLAKGNTNGQVDYWEKLSNKLNIEEGKLNSIMDLNTKNNEAIDALRKAKPSDLTTQIKEIRIAEKKEVEKILGAVRYQKKLDFDKKWNAMGSNASQDKGKMKELKKK